MYILENIYYVHHFVLLHQHALSQFNKNQHLEGLIVGVKLRYKTSQVNAHDNSYGKSIF